MKSVGLAGNARSGKSTLARRASAEYGFEVMTGSGIISSWATEEGLAIESRVDYQSVLRYVRERRGSTILLETQLAAARGAIIIDSLKIADEARRFKGLCGLIVAVECPVEIRYQRDRTSDDGKVRTTSLEQFIADEADEQNDPDPLGLQTLQVMAAADVTIDGSGTTEDTWNQFQELVVPLL